MNHHFASGLYAKEAEIPAGSTFVQHRHEYDHLSILAVGTVEIEVDGQRARYTGPACIVIEAGKHHGVTALTDAVWYCIHATDATEADEADEQLIQPADHAQVAALLRA